MAVDLENLTFSDIDLAFVKHFLRIEPEIIEDDMEISLFIATAKSFVFAHTGMTIEELNEANYINIIYLKLISDLYHNRNSSTNGTNLAMEPIFELLLKGVRKVSL